ncbi:hypothetical protein HTG_15940 [Natrinema mahii]|nr:hypothetical protein HTG_15940 [Natrinema mahii]
MDPLATYVVTKAAREKALAPGDERLRPTLIEAVQYRYGAHTTADDPDKDEVEEWRESPRRSARAPRRRRVTRRRVNVRDSV